MLRPSGLCEALRGEFEYAHGSVVYSSVPDLHLHPFKVVSSGGTDDPEHES